MTLLGQNVNSYRDLSSTDQSSSTHLSRGFSSIYRSKEGGRRFSDLLDKVAQVHKISYYYLLHLTLF